MLMLSGSPEQKQAHRGNGDGQQNNRDSEMPDGVGNRTLNEAPWPKNVAKAKQDEQGCDNGVCLNDEHRACGVEPSVMFTTPQELKRVEHEHTNDNQDCPDKHLPNA